jgi:hypothetical protein
MLIIGFTVIRFLKRRQQNYLEKNRVGLKNVHIVRQSHLQCCGSVTLWYGIGSADPYN